MQNSNCEYHPPHPPPPPKKKKKKRKKGPQGLTQLKTEHTDQLLMEDHGVYDTYTLHLLSEKTGKLTKIQCGLGKHHSAINNIVGLKGHVGDVSMQKQRAVVLFLDFVKAYEITSKHSAIHEQHGQTVR